MPKRRLPTGTGSRSRGRWSRTPRRCGGRALPADRLPAQARKVKRQRPRSARFASRTNSRHTRRMPALAAVVSSLRAVPACRPGWRRHASGRAIVVRLVRRRKRRQGVVGRAGRGHLRARADRRELQVRRRDARTGLDCSGFVRHVFQEVTGVSLPRTSKEMSTFGAKVGAERSPARRSRLLQHAARSRTRTSASTSATTASSMRRRAAATSRSRRSTSVLAEALQRRATPRRRDAVARAATSCRLRSRASSRPRTLWRAAAFAFERADLTP